MHLQFFVVWHALKRRGSKANRSVKGFVAKNNPLSKLFVWSQAATRKQSRKSHLGSNEAVRFSLFCYYLCFVYITHLFYEDFLALLLLYTKTFGVVINSLPCNCVLQLIVSWTKAKKNAKKNKTFILVIVVEHNYILHNESGPYYFG